LLIYQTATTQAKAAVKVEVPVHLKIKAPVEVEGVAVIGVD